MSKRRSCCVKDLDNTPEPVTEYTVDGVLTTDTLDVNGLASFTKLAIDNGEGETLDIFNVTSTRFSFFGADALMNVQSDSSSALLVRSLAGTIMLRAQGGGAARLFTDVPFVAANYTVATLPSATSTTRGVVYVSDEIGGPTLAFSNGTNWLRLRDNVIVS